MSERQRVALFTILNKTEQDIEIARRLIAMGWKIIGSAGTARFLNEAGLEAQNVAELTGRGPILNHKVVTLSEPIHAGLMATTEEELAEMAELGFLIIDLVYVGLYDLLSEIANPDRTIESIMNATDQGGVAILTSAGKGNRIVISDPDNWDMVLKQLEENGDVDEVTRNHLVAKGYYIASGYRLASARELGKGLFDGMVGEMVGEEADYGENPYMKPARVFTTTRFEGDDPFAPEHFEVVAGRSPSFNNRIDVERLVQTITHVAAVNEVNHGSVPCISIVGKHGNLCGGSTVSSDPEAALRNMIDGDPRAIFGGLVMSNFRITEELADVLHTHGLQEGRRLYDGIIAPGFDQAAIDLLSRKKDKCRFIANPALDDLSLDAMRRIRPIRRGFLTQPNYTFVLDWNDPDLQVFGKRDAAVEADLELAWAIGCTANSNTITIVKDGMLLGNAPGGQDRVGAGARAIEISRTGRHDLAGAVVYSDSFFPFIDGVALLIAYGVRAIFASSGSRMDKKVQALCQAAGVTLYMMPDVECRGFFGH